MPDEDLEPLYEEASEKVSESLIDVAVTLPDIRAHSARVLMAAALARAISALGSVDTLERISIRRDGTPE